jgi:hypothetical protein
MCGKMLELKQLSDGMVVVLSGTIVMGINSNVVSTEM